MTEVLQSSPSHFPSPSSSPSTPCAPTHYNNNSNNRVQERDPDREIEEEEEDEESCGGERKQRERGEGDQLSVLALLVTTFRKSLVGCSIGKELCSMEIGVPTNVRHVAHVTFDRFNGFLGLPVEFEPEVPRRPPSASTNVFGVSTESMQLSFDSRGNSVPTILLLMQRHLYARGGLQAEGIFRINGGNSQEEYIRDQLNRGVIPDGIDVHCLAGLIKAWFRELPTGILDSLPPEEVMRAQSEEECARLVRVLRPMEAALLDWAINLMADVAQFEHFNKMNARNVAMVFAPNMTQMSDPLTALMYAVQVMNFLKTLIVKTLKDREDNMVESMPLSPPEPSDENDHQSSSRTFLDETKDDNYKENQEENLFVNAEPTFDSPSRPSLCDSTTNCGISPVESWSLIDSCPCEVVSQVSCSLTNEAHEGCVAVGQNGGIRTSLSTKSKNGVSSSLSFSKGSNKKLDECAPVWMAGSADKSLAPGILGRINSRTELFEAWR